MPLHGLTCIQQQIHKNNLEELGIRDHARRSSVDPDMYFLESRIATKKTSRVRQQHPDRKFVLRRTLAERAIPPKTSGRLRISA